jgi:class 3 adenylate cyclase/tetratricopeptide (TPR) repeat protein
MTITTDPSVGALGGQGVDLGPYVSSLHGQWLATTPDRRWDRVPGTLVFADVSGFTPLAERLARRGKVGAEELTDTLNLVFTDLLDVAARFGGDCLKFGGDALLLLFTGAGHERRACAAAHGMDGALRALRRQRTGAGLAKLGISMGVHSGALDGFLVGSSHQELVLAGPAVSSTLWLEAAAAAGQILLGDATAAALDLDDVEELDGGLLRLRRAPAAVLPGAPHPAPRDTSAALPVVLREHLDGHRHDGEHRLASVGFLKFAGTDHVLAGEGPDALAAALDALITSVQQRCAEHGVTFVGTDVDRDGGKVILATGMPSASPDDEDRLLVTLREVLDECASSALLVRAGANRGRVFAVDLGSASRRTFTVMGDAVNLAARVMGQAETGQLVATTGILERRRTEFELVQLEPFTVKGKRDPVLAAQVGTASGRRDETSNATPLIGRQSDLAAVRRVFESALGGTGGVVELVGDPGIGKSKLVSTVTQLDHGLTPLRFEAGRYSLATPYFALRRGMRAAMGLALDSPASEVEGALRAVVADMAPELARWIPLLAVPLGLDLPDTPDTADLDPGHRRTALHSAVADLLGRVLSTPTLITVEDAHWLDGASCELLASLFADIGRRPWAALVTRRDVPGGLELHDPGVVRRHLGPLTRDDLVALAKESAGDAALPPGALDGIVDRSGGNPLFLQELVRATVEGGVTELPDTIEAVIAASLDTLRPPDRSLLRHAAVLGGHVPIDVLARMLGTPRAVVERDVARLSHFLHPSGRSALRFRHILLRDVAYEGLSFRARRALHERAAEILEAGTDEPEEIAELLSIHFHRAGQYQGSWHYSRLAGERARRAGAPTEAAGFFEHALEAARRLDHVPATAKADVAEALGDTWELGGRYDRASGAYQLARRHAGDDVLRQARLCRKVGYVRDHEGRYSAALRWFTRGIKELATSEDQRRAAGLRAELTTAVVSSRIRQGRHHGAVQQIQAAIDDATTGGAEAALARALTLYDQLLVDQGRYAEARHSERAVEIYERLGDHRGAAAALNEMGSTAYWLGQWDAAVRCWERAIESDRRAGALVNHAIYLNNIGEVRSDQGRWEEAEVLLLEAHELWTAGGWRIGSGWAMSNLGRLATRDGRLALAEERLADAVGILRDIGADIYVLETEVRDVERRIFTGDPVSALASVDELRDRAGRLGMGGVLDLIDRLEGCARCLVGELDAGEALLRHSVESSRDKGAEYEVAAGLEAIAWASRVRGDENPGLAVEATALYRTLGVVRSPELPMRASATP